ncbi:MAG: OmpA family protein [Marinobacter sp.]|nr:OmpA family protein [Marinobacter sp.]
MNIHTGQTIKRGFRLSALVLSSVLVTSCAMSPAPPQGAENARNQLTLLQQDPALADRARVEIRAAEEAVRIAEQPLAADDAALGEHRVYMAERAVAIAETRATTRYAEDQRLRLGEERDAARLQARTLEVDRARSAADAARVSEADAAAAATLERSEFQRQIDALQAEITDRGVVLTLGDVLFATGSAELQRGASSNLDRLVSFLSQYPDRRAHIEGHTDSVGSVEYNQSLSLRRADSVRSYLTQRGVAPQRLTTSGVGMDRPVASNANAAGRQQNRRVEIIIENPDRPR